MSKSILVRDTPKSCSECNMGVAFSAHYGTVKCLADNELKECNKYEFTNDRHPQCPLQDTTELLEVLDRNILGLSNKDYTMLHKALGGNDEI